MHDPMTQAFTIPNPFAWHEFGGCRHYSPLITIWHRDPEKGVGGDDSCDWHGSRGLTQTERDWLHKEGESEHGFWIRGVPQSDHADDGTMTPSARYWPGSMIGASALELAYAAWTVILWRMPGKGEPLYRRRGSSRQLQRGLTSALPYLLGMVANGSDSLQQLIVRARSVDREGKEAMGELFVTVARIMRQKARPWWKHPRWHVHHWSVQVHPWQTFNRWAWSRCATCGKRFAWGESVHSRSWHITGPRLMRGEKDVHHGACIGAGLAKS